MENLGIVGSIASIISLIIALWVKYDTNQLRKEINIGSPNRNKTDQHMTGGKGNKQAGGNIGS